MAQSFLQPLSGVSPTTANSTPTGVSTDIPTYPSAGMSTQSPIMAQPNQTLANQTPAFGNIAPVQSPTEMYNPTVGVSTQKVADATYANAMNQAVSGSAPVPSSVVGSGTNLSSAGATRSTNEAILQQYLDQQKQYQQQLLQANQAGPTESAAAQRYNQLKTQAALNQEQALASGETSSFAGGEAQRVARTDAIKLAGAAADLQYMTGQREQAVKTLEALMASGDKSFANQLKIQELQQTVSGIDKQAQDTFFNISQTEGIDLPYDTTKTATENLSTLQKARATKQAAATKELSPRQASMLNSIINQANNSPLIKAADRAVVLKDSIDNARANPKAGYVQQNLVYSYVQALDTYQSAVREGEMKAVSNLDSLFGQFDNTIQKINNGQYARPEVVKQMASAAEMLYNSISKAAEQKDKSFAAQADVLGVGEDYSVYRGKFQRSYETGKEQDYSAQDKAALDAGYTQEEIDAFKQKKGFSKVGSDTNPATEQNLTTDFASMNLLQPAKPLELTSDSFANMGGLMQSTTPLQMASVEIPKSSKLSFVNNNPGNLRFAEQYGAVKGEGGFAKFKTPQEGFDALVRQIKLDVSRGHTIASFINKFAPPTENDTKLYIQQAVKALGYKADTPLSKVPLNELAKFVALKESSTKIN